MSDGAKPLSGRHVFLSWPTFIRCQAVFVLMLMGLSWKLWGPVTEFPQIALLDVAQSLPQAIDWCCSIVLAVSLFSLMVAAHHPRVSRALMFVVASALGCLFVLNQHRLQPWAWQTFIFATLTVCFWFREHDIRNRSALKSSLRAAIVSIYIYSAISKFDYQFLHTTGVEFAETIGKLVGFNAVAGEGNTSALVYSFPVGELLIGVLLWFAATRKVGLIAAILFHLVLIAILGPWGMGHHWPVIVWNVQFILLLLFLFGTDTQPTAQPGRDTGRDAMRFVGMLFAGFVVAMPLLKPIGWCDHWLAWGLYSPGNSRVELRVADTAKGSIPPSLHPFLIEDQESLGSSEFDLGTWSLEELGVPVYPQARFQVAAAAEFSRRHEIESRVEIVTLSEADWWTGERRKIMDEAVR